MLQSTVGGCGPRLRQNKLEYCTVTVTLSSEGLGGACRELNRRSEDSISADRSAMYSIIKLIVARFLSAWGVRIADGRNRQQCMMRRLNASKPAEHPPDKGKSKSIETFGWDHRLRRQTSSCHSIWGSKQQCICYITIYMLPCVDTCTIITVWTPDPAKHPVSS